MRNKIINFCFLAILLFLSACGLRGKPETVSFMVFGEPAELKAYQNLVDAFQKQNTDVAIELIHIPSQGDYLKRFTADLAGGAPADVVLINYRRFSGLAIKGAFEPLDPYLEKSSKIKYDDFYKLPMRAFSLKDQTVCIPQNISSLVTYYNKDLFDAAGLSYPNENWTWNDFISAAKALTLDTNQDGSMDQYGVGVEPEFIRVAPYIWQNSGKISSESALTLTDPVELEAVQWFVDWQVKYHIVPNAVEEKAESSESRFMNGRTAMYFNSRRLVPTLREITAFDWDVAPLPIGRSKFTILHSDAYCLTAASKHKEAAWAFIEFANSVEGQTIIAKTGRTVPSLIQVAESQAFLGPTEKPEHSRVFIDVIPYILRLPQQANWADIEEICDEELQRAFYGDVTVPEAMQSAVSRARPLFTENE
jgi:multiple sugar transport system substrate-binding protein